MASVVEALMDNAPLDCREVVVVHGHILLTTPAKAAVVDDDILSILQTKACAFDETAIRRLGQVGLIYIANSETQVTDNQIVRTAKVHLTPTNQNTIARCRLACNGDILEIGTQITCFLSIGLYLDDTTHTKDDGGILLTGNRQCPAQ